MWSIQINHHRRSVGSEKKLFLKAQPTGFLGFIGVLSLSGFLTFYLNEQLGSLLVDLGHQLSLYLD